MLTHYYFPGDEVLNLLPHYSESSVLIPLNARGTVVENKGSQVSVSWNLSGVFVSDTLTVNKITRPMG